MESVLRSSVVSKSYLRRFSNFVRKFHLSFKQPYLVRDDEFTLQSPLIFVEGVFHYDQFYCASRRGYSTSQISKSNQNRNKRKHGRNNQGTKEASAKKIINPMQATTLLTQASKNIHSSPHTLTTSNHALESRMTQDRGTISEYNFNSSMTRESRDVLLSLNDYSHKFGSMEGDRMEQPILTNSRKWRMTLDYCVSNPENNSLIKEKLWNDHNVSIYSIRSCELYCTRDMKESLNSLANRGYKYGLQFVGEVGESTATSENFTSIDTLHKMHSSMDYDSPKSYSTEYEAYKHLTIDDFDRIATGLFHDSGLERSRDFVLSLPFLHESFRDKRELASLIYRVFFHPSQARSQYLLQNENLTWLQSAVAFKPFLKYLPRDDCDYIYETMLTIWSKLNRQQYLLHKMNSDIQFSFESGSFDVGNIVPADFLTERFLYLYLSDELQPSKKAVHILAQSYIVCNQKRKLQTLLEWMESERFDRKDVEKLRAILFAMDGGQNSNVSAHIRIDDVDSQEILVTNVLRNGHVNTALTYFVSNFYISEALASSIRKYFLDPHTQVDMNLLEKLNLTHKENERIVDDKDEKSISFFSIMKEDPNSKLDSHQVTRKAMKTKFNLGPQNVGLLLEFMQHTDDMELVFAFEKEVKHLFRENSIPPFVESTASTIILQHYIQHYDIQNGEKHFRSTFSTPFKSHASASVQPSKLTYEWMKRAASLTAKSKFIEELEKAESEMKHIV